MLKYTPSLGVHHVQEKQHKHNHASHRKDVHWKEDVETGSAAPQVSGRILNTVYRHKKVSTYYLISKFKQTLL